MALIIEKIGIFFLNNRTACRVGKKVLKSGSEVPYDRKTIYRHHRGPSRTQSYSGRALARHHHANGICLQKRARAGIAPCGAAAASDRALQADAGAGEQDLERRMNEPPGMNSPDAASPRNPRANIRFNWN